MFGYTQSYLIKNFTKVKNAIKKKCNVDIEKISTKDDKKYIIFENEDSRALTLFEEKDDLLISQNSLQLKELEFYILLAIAVSDYGVYRGTYKQLLKYLGLSATNKNIELVDLAIESLKNNGYLHEVIKDKTTFTLILKDEAERNFEITIEMLKESKKIIEKNNKPIKYLPRLVQVWAAIKICSEEQPFTYAKIEKLTGLSYYQIRELKKLLESSDIFLTSRAGNRFHCLGMNVDLNAFYNK